MIKRMKHLENKRLAYLDEFLQEKVQRLPKSHKNGREQGTTEIGTVGSARRVEGLANWSEEIVRAIGNNGLARVELI